MLNSNESIIKEINQMIQTKNNEMWGWKTRKSENEYGRAHGYMNGLEELREKLREKPTDSNDKI